MLPLLELHTLTQAFPPLCFFSDVALPPSLPEAPLLLDPAAAFATSTDGHRTPDKALGVEGREGGREGRVGLGDNKKQHRYWCSKKKAGPTVWGVGLGEEGREVSAVTLTFPHHLNLNVNSVCAPTHVKIQAAFSLDPFTGEEIWEEVGGVCVADLPYPPSLPASSSSSSASSSSSSWGPLRIPCRGGREGGREGGRKARAVRIQFTGYGPGNEGGYHGLRDVVVSSPRPDPRFVDVRFVLEEIQGWLVSVAQASEGGREGERTGVLSVAQASASEEGREGGLHSLALAAMERVTTAAGLLSGVLRFVDCLLMEDEEGREKEVDEGRLFGRQQRGGGMQVEAFPLLSPSLPPPLLHATTHLLSCLQDQHLSIQQTLSTLSLPSSLPSSLSSSSPTSFPSLLSALRSAAFDPDEMSPSGLSLSQPDHLLVRCSTAAHSHALLSLGFSSGCWAWEFQLAEDITNDESICLGAAVKPLTSSSYNSSPSLWMYRCYNGNLYKRGGQISGVSKARIHPQDVVRVELDHEKHTLSYCINGEKEQGVCFSEVVGEVFPAVAFYGANRAVRLVGAESVGGGVRAGVRWYLPNDAWGRRRWEGELVGGRRGGDGRLS